MSTIVSPASPAKGDRRHGTPSERRIRVVHLVSALNIGGLEKVVFDLVRLTNPEEFDVRVLCLGEAGALASDFEALRVKVTSLGMLGRGKLRGILAIANNLRRDRPNVLHTHNPSPHFQGALAARLSDVPVVVHTKHGRNYPDQWRKVWANRIATWFTSRVVAVSSNAADVARTVERIAANKVEVICNGIDLDRFNGRNAPQSRDPRRAIHVARISDPPKDHATLLRAVRRVVDAEPTFHLNIVGDGPQRNEMECLCRELRLENHVAFLGFRSDVNELLDQCGLFLLSTTTEGLSITLLEAMANCLPVVTTRVGGNPEVVADGRTGLLVPAGREEVMAAAMLRIIQEPGLATEMGSQGRLAVEERFDLRKVVARYEEIYCELLAKRGRR
jgi:glycosyltransferase involved in cell wall biosynthesis